MKIRMIFFFAVAFSTANLEVEAQLLRKLKNAAEAGVSRAVERTVEKQVQKATERQLEKAFENLYGDLDSTSADGSAGAKYDFSKIMGSINMNVPTESSYHFTGYAEMEITSTDEKGNASDPVTIHSLMSKDNDYYGMQFLDEQSKEENEKTVVIFDEKNQATVMLMENEDERSSMAFSLDWDGMMEGADIPDDEAEPTDPNDFEYEKTGNTKNILGYTCDEYKVSSEEMEGTYWVTQSEIDGFVTLWGKNNPFITKRMKSENTEYFAQLPEGNVMEMDFMSKEDQTRSQMKMVAIEKDHEVSYDMEEYPNPMKGAQ